MQLLSRMAGAATAGAVAATVVLATAPAASASGTGGVDLRPLDTNATAFHVDLRAGQHKVERFALTNLTGTLSTTLANLSNELGTYNSFPTLTVTPPPGTPATTYSGTMTVTMVQP